MYVKLFRLLMMFVVLASSAHALPAQQVFKLASPSIFALYGLDQETSNPVILGSAVAVTKTILATNCHVAFSGNNLSIYVSGERKAGRLIYNNINTDLCLIEVPDVLLKPAKFGDASEMAIGENIYAVGDPNGSKKIMSKGIISNTLKINEDDYDFRTELFIPSGISGGGIFDSNAELIGITKAVYKGKSNIKTIIRSDWILDAIKKPVKANQDGDEDDDLELIDTFGDDDVGLYDYDDECYIHLYGFDQHDNIIGTALWNPNNADRILVFQNARSANKTFYLFENEIVKKQGLYKLTPIESYLLLNNAKYQFVGVINSDANSLSPFMVVILNQSLLPILMSRDSFVVQIKNFSGKADDTMMLFGLFGFKEAMDAYRSECNQPKPS